MSRFSLKPDDRVPSILSRTTTRQVKIEARHVSRILGSKQPQNSPKQPSNAVLAHRIGAKTVISTRKNAD